MLTQEYHFFDPAKFEEQTLGEPIVQREVKSTFLDKTPALISGIQEKAAQNDGLGLERLLHKLKASVSILCLPAMREEVIQMETDAGDHLGEDAYKQRLAQLVTDLNTLLEELRSFEIAD